MKTYTICGSFKFEDIMMEEVERLTLEGYCILTPIKLNAPFLYF